MKTVTPEHIQAPAGVGAVDSDGKKKRIGEIVSDQATETMQLRKIIQDDLIPAIRELIQESKNLTAANERKADELLRYFKSEEHWQRMGEELGTRERKA